jgi:hypothetical protein
MVSVHVTDVLKLTQKQEISMKQTPNTAMLIVCLAYSTLEAVCSSETLVLHSHNCENLKFKMIKFGLEENQGVVTEIPIHFLLH